MILTLFDYLLGQSQVYYAGKSQYIGVFDTKVKASFASEIARKLLDSDPYEAVSLSGEEIEANIRLALSSFDSSTGFLFRRAATEVWVKLLKSHV